MSPATEVGPQPLRSKHTANFANLFDQLGVSVLVSTYLAGKLVLLRSDGARVNTHFRDFPRPIGLAADRTLLAASVAHEIRQFRNLPPVCRHLVPPGRYDACYLPRATHITGDIDIHEMAWGSLAPRVPGEPVNTLRPETDRLVPLDSIPLRGGILFLHVMPL